MERFAIHAQRIVLPDIVAEGYLVIEDGKLAAFELTPPACRIVEYRDAWVSPGFLDTHIHGFAGHDVMDCDAAGLVHASRELAAAGTAAWLPTTLTASPEHTRRACASVAEAVSLAAADDLPSARMAGIFLEGPFFSPEKAGAQDIPSMCDPSLDLLDMWQEACGHMIVKSALAPERNGSLDYIAGCDSRRVIAAIGHTAASYEQAVAAAEAGAAIFVHTYNAMSALAHRKPGVVGAAMVRDDTFAEIICDGVHVHPGAVAALAQAKGWDRMVLITDCLSCGGPAAQGVAPHVGDKPVELRNGAAWLQSGNLAGSVLTMAKAVRNVVEWGIASPEDALRSASEVPALAHALGDRFGFIRAGRDADLAVMDADMNLIASYIGGMKV